MSGSVIIKVMARMRTGQIALPFILVVSGIIMEITIASTIVAYFLSSSGLSERLSVRAALAARTGVNDALIRIVRDKEYGASTQNYSFNVDRDVATIAVSRIVNVPANIYVYSIVSVGAAGARQRKMIGTLSVDQVTGRTRFESLVEVPVF